MGTDRGVGVVVVGWWVGVRGVVCNEREVADASPTIVQQQHKTKQFMEAVALFGGGTGFVG
jgi:hypothetical protein